MAPEHEHATQNGDGHSASDETAILERAAICRAVISPREGVALFEMLDPEHFYFDYHRDAWQHMVRAAADGNPLDLVRLCELLTPRWGLERALAITVKAVEDVDGLGLVHSQSAPLARMVRAQAAKRLRLQLAELVRSPNTPTDAIADQLEGIAELERDPQATHPVLERQFRGDALLASNIPPLPSLLGDRLLIRGGLAVLAGGSGLGKSFLAMQMMRGLASGTDLLGLPCTQCRVGMIQLEMPDEAVKERLAGLASEGPREWLERTSFLNVPDVVADITQEETLRWMVSFVRGNELDVTFIDAVNQVHTLDDNKNADMALVIRAVKKLRARTGTCVVLLHHVRKTPNTPESAGSTGERSRTSALDAVRGAGRFGNDPDLVLVMFEALHGMTQLVPAKIRHGKQRFAFWMTRDEQGYFHVTDSPETRSEKTEDKIVKWFLLHERGTVDQIASGTGLGKSTVYRHVKAMPDVAEVPSTNPAEYEFTRFEEP
jgi:hypothetical protein